MSSKKPSSTSKKHSLSQSAYLDRLQDYKLKLEQARQIMNNVIRQAVYRDAQIDINKQYEKQRINQLKQEINHLNEENMDLRERLQYYDGVADQPASVIYMDFVVREGRVCLEKAYENEEGNEIIVEGVGGVENGECVAIDISWD